MLSLYLLTAVFALGVLGSIWWFFPRWQLTHFYGDIGSSKDRADIEDNFRKTLSQVFSGLLLIGGLGLTFQQLLDVRKATSEQLLVSRKQQLADQFSKALGHIAESSPSIRVGGTYSLEEIGRLDSGYHSQIMEVLSEDVRAHALPGNNRDPVVRAGKIHCPGPKENRSLDISRPDLRQVDLEAFNFQGLQLRELNLEGANLRNGNLREANIDGSRLVGAKLNGAILERASAIGANFSGAAFTAVSDHVANLGKVDSTIQRNTFILMLHFREGGVYGSNGTSRVLADSQKSELWQRPGRPRG